MSSGLARVGRALHVMEVPPRRQAYAFSPAPARPVMRRQSWVVPMTVVAAFAAALWPHWRWAAARLADGSDDPLGLAALAVLALLVARAAPGLRRDPVPAWMAAAVLLTAAATLLGQVAPPLLGAVVAALAVAAVLAAVRPATLPATPLVGLAVLALPVVSSLQFYAGYPLRLVTAEASTLLLQLAGVDAARSGSAMVVDGRLIVVDAPCSGVQMVWMAYFAACSIAAWRGLAERAFVRRLMTVGLVVLAGNVLRNTVLVALEAHGDAPAAWVHDAVGAAVLALVCAVVVWRVDAARPVAQRIVFPEPGMRLGPRTRVALVALLATCALLPLAAADGGARSVDEDTKSRSEPPRDWNGRALRPLALGSVEARFAARFPGRIERLTDEDSVLVWREVRTPTRMLHPAADCYRGLGYRIADARLERDAAARLWRCFVADRDGQRLRVCERIEDANGLAFTDPSSWFWAAQLGRSTGPWRAITVATPLDGAT